MDHRQIQKYANLNYIIHTLSSQTHMDKNLNGRTKFSPKIILRVKRAADPRILLHILGYIQDGRQKYGLKTI
jgi:hypothetical protein